MAWQRRDVLLTKFVANDTGKLSYVADNGELLYTFNHSLLPK